MKQYANPDSLMDNACEKAKEMLEALASAQYVTLDRVEK